MVLEWYLRWILAVKSLPFPEVEWEKDGCLDQMIVQTTSKAKGQVLRLPKWIQRQHSGWLA